jgi:hypothetical protein
VSLETAPRRRLLGQQVMTHATPPVIASHRDARAR